MPARETTHTTRDRRSFSVREARRRDATALLEYAEALFAEPGLSLLYGPGEFTKTLTEEEEFIACHEGPNSLLLTAWAGDDVIASLAFRASPFPRTRHTGTFGLGVAKGWRGVGVGSLLLERLVAWATEHPHIERVGMEVFETNPRALRLYRRFGFCEEGRRRGAFRLDGRRVDSIMMGLLLPPKTADPTDPREPRAQGS
jgi:RimJ/RimL family protein N-acetyltransferase